MGITLQDYNGSRALPGCLKLFLIAIIAATFPLAGCGKVSHGDRVPLEGTVTKGGEPLEDKATIYFDPTSGQDGVGASAGVDGGKFSIPAEGGPTPGRTYKVTVMTAPGIPPDGTPKDEIRIAQRFETTVEIPERDGKQPLQLDIEFE